MYAAENIDLHLFKFVFLFCENYALVKALVSLLFLETRNVNFSLWLLSLHPLISVELVDVRGFELRNFLLELNT